MGSVNSDTNAGFASSLTTVQEYLVQWKSCMDSKGIYVISPTGRTFDCIAFSMLSKAYRLSKCCIALLEAGYPDESFGMARSIIECSLNLRYLTLDKEKIDSRSNNFVDFVFCEKKHFLEQCRKYFVKGQVLDAIEAFADKEKIEERWASIVPGHVLRKNQPLNDWKLIESNDWNGWKIATEPHPLDDQINKSGLIGRQYAADYRGGSAMVHCTIRALDNVFSSPGIPFRVGENLETTFHHGFEPLIIIVTNLYFAARYAFYGANEEGTECFDKLFEDASSKLIYARQS